MKTVKTTLILFICSILLSACEKEIDLDLKESDHLYVVEAIVNDNLGENFVLISKTRAYNNNGAIEKISNAIVQIKDGVGGVFNLYEDANNPGFYTNPNLIGIAGRTYELNVNIDSKLITGTSFMNPRIVIDSLTFDQEPDFGGEEEPRYSITCHLTDPLNVVNFYRMKPFIGTDKEQIDGYMNWNDDVIDGLSTGLPVFNVTYEKGDVATLELLSVDEPNFRYFTALRSSQGGEVPGNPKTNLSGEKVVGYFGAYAKSESTIIIGE